MIEAVCDHGSIQNKVRSIFCKNSFPNRKSVFLKLDFENDKENSLELFIKHFKNMKDVCVSIPKELSTYIILILISDYKSNLKYKKKITNLDIVFFCKLDPWALLCA